MEIKDVLDRKLMILNLKSNSKKEVIEELINPLVDEGIINSKNEFLEKVMAREAQSTTGIGMGVAIPHGKSKVVRKPAIVFGKSQKGLDYEALDDKPSYIFFLIAVPEGSENEHLKVLSLLSRKLMHEEIRTKLMDAKSEEEVIEAFN
ncbi:PTS sugar transporter subunit IIA [Alkaliphilus peptidifermentans]|uniref:PTS system D-fructose-specific IIA component (F1P-forming), Frc family n=1 Tax=Alkaliphilus peptidifermentans DSM 18978 TaxID=1120976 RepID=A0A1G5F2Q8_9FIRM|nr:fructose PTS transporter subunit IIA [Alkaliphilus peptidifermentans]SCY33503.1 PTS system D-fructose-specific IIA component (F1P-forming), Frc family [Alkaliphilus peptidifermentans DSM 18978]